ncbi:hypothetical protein F4678DRAFT_477464, partial [Xylaria arbuscula]
SSPSTSRQHTKQHAVFVLIFRRSTKARLAIDLGEYCPIGEQSKILIIQGGSETKQSAHVDEAQAKRSKQKKKTGREKSHGALHHDYLGDPLVCRKNYHYYVHKILYSIKPLSSYVVFLGKHLTPPALTLTRPILVCSSTFFHAAFCSIINTEWIDIQSQLLDLSLTTMAFVAPSDDAGECPSLVRGSPPFIVQLSLVFRTPPADNGANAAGYGLAHEPQGPNGDLDLVRGGSPDEIRRPPHSD